MRLLLDTQVFLWLQLEPERVAAGALELLTTGSNEVLLSAASSWEIAVKYALNKLPLPEPPREYVPTRMRRDRIDGLPISHLHSLHVATLPMLHRDPFDRLLVAQARVEEATLVTADARIGAYEVATLWG
jgi:PIN domain nuclease of toxin-antitoxin system